MKNRLPLIIFAAVCLSLFVIGSFADLQIAEAVYSKQNGFGMVLEMFGTLPGYGGISLIAGMLIANEFKMNHSKGIKALICAIGIICIGIAFYFFANDVYSTDGANIEDKKWIGFLVSGVLVGGLTYLGTLLAKTTQDRKKAMIVLLTIIVVSAFILGFVQLVKIIMSRPRYRFMVENNLLSQYTNWWEPFTGTKLGDNKDFYKSFPSGHSAGACIATVQFSFLSLIVPKMKKHTTLIIVMGSIWSLVTAFSRMTLGAHFMSDVSFALLVTGVSALIGNEILLKILSKTSKEVSE